MNKNYKVIGRMFGLSIGQVFAASEEDVKASGLLGATLEEIPETALTPASEEVVTPVDPALAPQAPVQAPAAPPQATTKPAGGPPMPGQGKAAVTPVQGK